MLAVLIAHCAVVCCVPWIFRLLGPKGFLVLAAVPALSCVGLLTQYGCVVEGHAGKEQVDWVPELGLELLFRLDGLSWIFLCLVLGVGTLVLLYCAQYFRKEDPFFHRHGAQFGAQMLAFSGAMVGLVTTDNLLVLFVFWELTTVLSYVLIGYRRDQLKSRRAAQQALIVTTAGGLAMLIGMVMLGQAAGSFTISTLVLHPPENVQMAVVLVVVGALSKSALVPFHFWLPGAMAAPTPVSAYLHAAAMVKAGIYLLARLAPAFAADPFWQGTLVCCGLTTMVLGGWLALRQNDLKALLAYGTVSQLGLMGLMFGVPGAGTTLAVLTLVVAHALFKACLFLVVGAVERTTGSRDRVETAGVLRQYPLLGTAAVVSAVSMAGAPFTLGFVAKETLYASLVEQGAYGVLVGVVAGSLLTGAYSLRFLWCGLAAPRGPREKDLGWMVLAPGLLAGVTLLFGFAPGWVEQGVHRYLGEFFAEHRSLHVIEFSPILALGLGTVAGGCALFWLSEQGQWSRWTPAVSLSGERAYRRLIALVDRGAIWVTGRTQRGSLFFYLAIILLVAMTVSVLTMLRGGWALPEVDLFDPDSPMEGVLTVIIVLAAFAVVQARKRFLAVVMISVTGYAVALIFALQGAPDLALTQMFVDTVILVTCVLAMRSLPRRLHSRGRFRWSRGALSLGFGGSIVVAALIALGARQNEPVSLHFPELAHNEAGGLNVVNVILVDLRAWDTFGEIAVLAVAITGVASLVLHQGANLMPGSIAASMRTTRRSVKNRRAIAAAQRQQSVWVAAAPQLASTSRSLIFELAVRLVFYPMMIFSVYLLLAGHNAPGGGFAGGVMAGLAVTLRYLVGGRVELAQAVSVSVGKLLGGGLALITIVGLIPLCLGGEIFQSALVSVTLPILGVVKVTTATFFDVGVYLVVVGLIVDILRNLGGAIDQRQEESGGELPIAPLKHTRLNHTR